MLIKDKYQREYNKFHKAQHQRSKSQMEKINRIIHDASQLTTILEAKERPQLRIGANVGVCASVGEF